MPVYINTYTDRPVLLLPNTLKSIEVPGDFTFGCKKTVTMAKRTVVVIGSTGSQARLPTVNRAMKTANLGAYRVDPWLQHF